jgi:hypothetical protein
VSLQKCVIIQNQEKQLQAWCSQQNLWTLLPHYIHFWSTLITVILFILFYFVLFYLFYFIFMQNISLISRSCFQYMFSVLHKRSEGLPYLLSFSYKSYFILDLRVWLWSITTANYTYLDHWFIICYQHTKSSRKICIAKLYIFYIVQKHTYIKMHIFLSSLIIPHLRTIM